MAKLFFLENLATEPQNTEDQLSKRKRKKLLKCIGWQEKKMDLRAREKIKYKAKRLAMREKGEERKGSY